MTPTRFYHIDYYADMMGTRPGHLLHRITCDTLEKAMERKRWLEKDGLEVIEVRSWVTDYTAPHNYWGKVTDEISHWTP